MMKTQAHSPIIQSLHVIWFALVGLLFYACVFGLIGLLGAALFTRIARADEAPVQIDAAFTGSWYDPANSGQGLMLQVLPNHQLLAIWFAYGPSGGQAWFGGVGSYSGNTAVIDAVQPAGGRWIPNFDAAQVTTPEWGSITFTFGDRDHGRVEFNSVLGFGSGGMDLVRLTNIAAHAAPSAAIGQPVALIADKDGSIYFSSSPNRIYKVAPDGMLTHVAGSGQAGYSGDGGPATEARFNFPLSYLELTQDPVNYTPLVGGLALDANHNLYVADAYNNRVRRIDANGIVTSVVGTGWRANSGDGGPAVDAAISWPQGIVVDKGGNVYVSSAYGPLRKFVPGGAINTLTGSNCGSGYLGPGLCVPEQIAIDASNNIYAPDAYCRVRQIRGDGAVFTVAGADAVPSGGYAFSCGYSGDGGLATKAAMSPPYAVAIGANGTMYIADTDNHCIRKVTSGIIGTFAGKCTHAGFGGDGGQAKDALLNRPRGVAVGADGSVYVADTDNRRVRRVAPNGIITTLAGNGGEIPDKGTIDASFTGNWYDPSQSGHGLMVEVLSDQRFLAYWFAYDPEGHQTWFGGLGTYSGNTATIDAIIPTGGIWFLTPTFAPVEIVPVPWGTLKFTFYSCRAGSVDFSSGYGQFGSGTMNLTRLTQPLGLDCL